MERQVAFKLNINNIVNSVYEKREGWNPNVLLVGKKEVSRVNLMAVVINCTTKRLTIDDGTASIEIITFDENDFSEFKTGTPILVVGRVREWQNKRFIVPEIIKQVEKEWLEVRKKELEVMKQIYGIDDKSNAQNNLNYVSNLDLSNSNLIQTVEKISVKNNAESNQFKSEIYEKAINESSNSSISTYNSVNVIKFIQESQEQEADHELLLEKFGKDTVDKLLETGDIYEIRPGKLKVL